MSASGGALLANDPHLGISMPSIWYLNGLHCRTVSAACPYDVAGVSFPGVPGVILGHNARIAWGATNIDPDVQDLVIEKVDPADPGAYLHDGASVPFTVRHEQIKVSGGTPVDLEIRSTVHGPILNGVDDRLADAPPMAIRWTANIGADRTFEAVLGLDTAATFADFRASLSLYGAPAQNFVYADVDGHIGYQFPGYVPIRSAKADRGDRPVRGDDGSGEWTGRVPFDDLPWQFDPVDGVVVTANNAAVDGEYPYFVAQEWDPGYRAERILDLIAQAGADGLTVAEMGQIQFDGSPLAARDVVQFLEGAPTTADGALISTRIADWDGVCDEASVGCAAFNAWQYRVLRDIFDDDLGPLARDYVGSPFSWVVLQQLLDDPTSAWWDDTATTGVTETADDIIGRAMDEAGAELRAAVGAPEGWTWGRLHTATFREATLGTSGIGPLEWYFNDGPHPVAGHGRRDRQHVLPLRVGLSGPGRHDRRAGRDRPRLRHDQHAELPADDRHGRPRRCPGGHHHRPVGQPVRPPLRRPGRAVAARPDHAVAVHPGRHRWGDRLDADPDALSAADRSGARRAGEVLLEPRREGRADRHVREHRCRVGGRRDPFHEEAIDDDRRQVAGDDRAGELVGDRRVRERHHRIPVEHVG